MFVGRDRNGTPRYAHVRGTADTFRQDITGSDKSYPFRYEGNGNQLFVFEAPIDLLSFICLYPQDWKNRSYLALGGVSGKALDRFLSCLLYTSPWECQTLPGRLGRSSSPHRLALLCRLRRQDVCPPYQQRQAYFSIYPVSYTHLDVYKRQIQLRDVNTANFTMMDSESTDVYKRQGPDWEKGRWKPRGTNGRNALYPRR